MKKNNCIPNCVLCRELENGITDDGKLLNKQLHEVFGANRLIYESSNWVVLPTVGCYIEGYVLAVNKQHYLSLYQCDFKSQKEFLDLINIMKNTFKKVYKCNMIYFEHGTIQREYSSCSVEHVHIHFIPFNKLVWNQFSSLYNPEYFKITNLNEFNNVIEFNKLSSYLLFSDIDCNTYIIKPDKIKYPSQFFRKFISNQFGINEKWDWKKEFYIKNMCKTYNKLCEYFRKNMI